MARLWQLGVNEIRPGTYFRTSSGDVVTESATNGIVALLYRSNWGPLNTVVDIDPEDLNNLKDIVGTGQGYEVARQALIGGAKKLRTVRVGTGGTKGWKSLYAPSTTKTVTNADGTKTTTTVAGSKVVGVYPKYPGSRLFYITIKTNLATNKREAHFYDDSMKLLEVITFNAGSNEATAMVNAVNNNSKYFTAKRKGTGKSKLANVTQSKFKVGKNPSVKVAQYAAGSELLERYRWNVVIADSCSDSVDNVIVSFVRQSYELGRLGMAVISGPSKFTFEERINLAASYNDWRVVFLLSGWTTNTGKKCTEYNAVGRIAGMIAACESNASITHLVIQDAFRPVESLTNSQMETAEQKGCLVVSLNESDQVWIDNANTTLITLGNDQDEGWKKIRRTKCRFELMDRINRTCDKLVGRLNNDARGRATILTAMTTVIREMIAERKLFEGSYAAENPAYKPVGDRAYFMLVIGDIDSMEKIYLDYNFSYANPFSELDTAGTA